MATTILTIPDICLFEIFKVLDDIDQISLYYTCKRLLKKKFVTLRQVPVKFEHSNYPSLLECANSITVLHQNVNKLLDRLTNNTNINNKENNYSRIKLTHLKITYVYTSPLVLHQNNNSNIFSTQQYKSTQLQYLNRLNQLINNNNNSDGIIGDLHTLTIDNLPSCKQFPIPSISELCITKRQVLNNELMSSQDSQDGDPENTTGQYFMGCNELREVSYWELDGSQFNNTISMIPKNLVFLYGFETSTPIPVGLLPPTLQVLSFNKKFNQEILPHSLPSDLNQLSFGEEYNQLFKVNSLPCNLKSISLGKHYNQPFHYKTLPPQLNELALSSEEYNHHLEHIPDSLQHLHLPYKLSSYPMCIKSLPHLTHIVGLDLMYPLPPGLVPNTVTHITFGVDFSQPILKKSLPCNLESLDFMGFWSHPIEPDTLPNTIKELKFGLNFNENIDVGVLPSQLVYLQLPHSYNGYIDRHALPNTLVKLINGNWKCDLDELNPLPTQLQFLKFSGSFQQDIKPGSLTHTRLTSVRLNYRYNRELVFSVFPTTLTKLSIGLISKFNGFINSNNQNHPLTSLTHLDIWDIYQFKNNSNNNQQEQTTVSLYPPNLTHLSIMGNIPIERNSLPPSITHLKFYGCYNQPLDHNTFTNIDDTPSHNIKSLKLYGMFNHPILSGDCLPQRITTLSFGVTYEHPVHYDILPKSIKKLIIHSKSNNAVFPSLYQLPNLLKPLNNK